MVRVIVRPVQSQFFPIGAVQGVDVIAARTRVFLIARRHGCHIPLRRAHELVVVFQDRAVALGDHDLTGVQIPTDLHHRFFGRILSPSGGACHSD